MTTAERPDDRAPGRRPGLVDRPLAALRNRPRTTLAVLFVATLVTTLWPLYRLSQRVIETTSLENAAGYADVLESFRSLYTSEVITRLRGTDIVVTPDYADQDHAIPLPATFSILLGKRIADQGRGGYTRLYSPFPFKKHRTGGLPDSFARQAWEHLSANPKSSFYRFQDDGDERLLRYARADVMRLSCVACHNNHPDSPRSTWQEGDVRGVLEVGIPLQNVVSKTEGAVRGTLALTTLMIAVVFLLLALAVRHLRKTTELLAKTNAQLHELSETDAMTRLANFGHFTVELLKEHRRAARFDTPYSLIFMDVDHFKAYNDSHGHQAGDDVLRRLADVLSRTARETDLVARYGGEEFVVLCPGITPDGAAVFAERLRIAVEATKFEHEEVGAVTISAGVAGYPDHAKSQEGVIRIADQALYTAKNNGRNQVVKADS